MKTIENETEQALGRFLELSVATREVLPMFSSAVDALWHALIEDGESYEDFCTSLGIDPVGHQELMGEGEIGWVKEYESRWGRLEDIWFTDKNGKIDTELRQIYRETGIVEASWDCGPGFDPNPNPTEGDTFDTPANPPVSPGGPTPGGPTP